MATEDAAELLSQLRGIHLPVAPAEPHIWPVAFSIIVIGLALLTYIFSRARRKGSWSKQATLELDRIINSENSQKLHNTAVLLKRVVLTHDQRQEIKLLSGDNWLRYLDEFFSTRYFSEGDGRLFGTAQYKQQHGLKPEIVNELKKLIKRKARSQKSESPRSPNSTTRLESASSQ